MGDKKTRSIIKTLTWSKKGYENSRRLLKNK